MTTTTRDTRITFEHAEELEEQFRSYVQDVVQDVLGPEWEAYCAFTLRSRKAYDVVRREISLFISKEAGGPGPTYRRLLPGNCLEFHATEWRDVAEFVALVHNLALVYQEITASNEAASLINHADWTAHNAEEVREITDTLVEIRDFLERQHVS